MEECLNFNLECSGRVGRRPFRIVGGGREITFFYESVLLTTDKIHEKRQM